MFLLRSRTTRRSGPEREREARPGRSGSTGPLPRDRVAFLVLPASASAPRSCPQSSGRARPAWTFGNMRALLREPVSLPRGEASPGCWVDGGPPQGDGTAGHPPSHRCRRARSTGACVLARPLPAWGPLSPTGEALGYRHVVVRSLTSAGSVSGKDSGRGAVCPRVPGAGGGAPGPPGAGRSGRPDARRRTPQPRSVSGFEGSDLLGGADHDL